MLLDFDGFYVDFDQKRRCRRKRFYEFQFNFNGNQQQSTENPYKSNKNKEGGARWFLKNKYNTMPQNRRYRLPRDEIFERLHVYEECILGLLKFAKILCSLIIKTRMRKHQALITYWGHI